MLFKLTWRKGLGPYRVNASTATTSSAAPQPLCPGAQKSCLWSRTKSCQCSPASQGSSGERRESFSHRFIFLHLFIATAKSFTLMIKAAVWAAQRWATWGWTPGRALTGGGRTAGLQSSPCNHRPGMHHFGTEEMLFLNTSLSTCRGTTCATYAHICIHSKHLHTKNSYSNLFSWYSYDDIWLKINGYFGRKLPWKQNVSLFHCFKVWENHFYLSLPGQVWNYAWSSEVSHQLQLS